MFNGSNFGAYPDTSANSADQFMDWNTVEALNGAGNPYDNNANVDANFYNNALSGLGSSSNAPMSSNQLVRRNTNQQLAARSAPMGGNLWQDQSTTGQVSEWPPAEENGEELERRALAAKKDAQAKRKQIPPFVQKLSR